MQDYRGSTMTLMKSSDCSGIADTAAAALRHPTPDLLHALFTYTVTTTTRGTGARRHGGDRGDF